MTSSGCPNATTSAVVADLRAQLRELSSDLQDTPRDERPAILRRMWELSREIAEAGRRPDQV